ncbi:DUF3667 domain-containing protein [Microbulbifer hydrolyticus]|uniref:DUF3667 domain-containing protein n=1 Tax=Microbulbifer hydrolyticus TaxID=48074 RepID=A0A6P1T8F3_9GAMM|nr:DUF3667 domain-containing protein [Microbulbifer hydrolyticus]MBB5211226.1 hypothetical protein [Microbulbifer hydrolyticus]QHQ38005.1 DUF3667 domain-containing protein [Microbulbifer hydrolyticus]
MSDTETLPQQELATPGPLAAGDETSGSVNIDVPSAAACGNCGAPLLGPHCYACGQPEKSLVRQFPELIGDFFSTVFGLDSRIARTFGPLLLNPGFLSNEYLAGRRVRYVSPVRLFVFLCLTAFFAANLSSDWEGGLSINSSTAAEAMAGLDLDQMENTIETAASVEEVLRLRDLALEEIADVRRESDDVSGLPELTDGLENVIRGHASRRIAQLNPAAAERLTEEDPVNIQLPQLEAAPSALNAWLERQGTRLTMNIARIQQDPNLLKDALFGAIPTALFIMLPIFALCLSLLYAFSRRLYMEHLIVALHSHAFLSLTLLLSVLLIDLRAWLTGPDTLPHTLFNLALLVLAFWVPAYLLLMQKRVYRQSWPVTTLKYSVLGVAYMIMLGIATTIAGLVSVASF